MKLQIGERAGVRIPKPARFKQRKDRPLAGQQILQACQGRPVRLGIAIIGIGAFSSVMQYRSRWSCRFSPTSGRSKMESMPKARRSPAAPMPESWRRRGIQWPHCLRPLLYWPLASHPLALGHNALIFTLKRRTCVAERTVRLGRPKCGLI